MKFAKQLLILFVLGILGAGILVFGGFADIAVTSGHSAPVRWILQTAMKKRVVREAAAIRPPILDDQARILRGASAYADMCEICHAAPGVKQTVLARGLLPEPPALADEAGEWSEAELFWIVKHGIKLTGMPAWGPTHNDEALWDIVAFLKRLPKLGAAEYQRMTESKQEHTHSHDADSAPPHSHE